ncbi:MAG: amidohydrolase [Ruminococcaceae bacterium]|nr:amidohydrolase [Oscillospiraceae bacterium]
MEKKYKIIDSHCHIYPDKIAQKASEATGHFYDLPASLDGKISTLLEHGARAGIDRFVVQSVATTPKQVSSINNFIATAVNEGNGKFTGLGTLHPDSEDMEADVNEIITLGLKGVKMHPDIQQVKLDDPRMHKIYELCEGRLPMLLHTGDCRYDYSNPNRMIPILEKYPNLTVIGAHFGGWSIWEEATAKFTQYENFLVDCSSSLYAISPQKAKELIMAYGTDRVLFGTDYPLWTPESEIERFMQLDLTDEQREDILYNNTAKLFDIK